MAEVRKSEKIPKPAADVWSMVSAFDRLHEVMPMELTASGEGIGAERTLRLANGAELVERLERLDNEKRELSYSIVSGPLPVKDYFATMKVTDAGGGESQLDWAATFEPAGIPEEQAVALIDGILGGGVAGFRKHFS